MLGFILYFVFFFLPELLPFVKCPRGEGTGLVCEIPQVSMFVQLHENQQLSWGGGRNQLQEAMAGVSSSLPPVLPAPAREFSGTPTPDESLSSQETSENSTRLFRGLQAFISYSFIIRHMSQGRIWQGVQGSSSPPILSFYSSTGTGPSPDFSPQPAPRILK